MYAIRHNGEEMWVASLDGHDGCTVIARNVPEPPPDPCAICPVKGVAIVDEAKKEANRLNRMTNAELIAELESRGLI